MKRIYIVLATVNALLLGVTGWSAYQWKDVGFLNYDWWFWFMNQYSVTLLVVLGLVVFSLKLAAIINPKVPSNAIIDLIKDTFGSEGKFPKIPER